MTAWYSVSAGGLRCIRICERDLPSVNGPRLSQSLVPLLTPPFPFMSLMCLDLVILM